MSDLIGQLDAKSFHAGLKQKIALVDFWSPWCGPCQIQPPVLKEFARRVAGRSTVAEVNADEAQKLAARFGIQRVPTLVLFKNGKVVHQSADSHSSASLIEGIENIA